MANQVIKLPREVADKYELVDYGPGSNRQSWGKHGTIDVNELTLERADRLYRNKWPKLKLKEEIKTGKGASLPAKS